MICIHNQEDLGTNQREASNCMMKAHEVSIATSASPHSCVAVSHQTTMAVTGDLHTDSRLCNLHSQLSTRVSSRSSVVALLFHSR